ncbi:MAG TPA: LysR substrate-binding domain-containing protein [Pseudoflavonifractor sp.]|nr:LysR substrate-binding domain-containing protein [Pseudoflavonifractor sp.]
MNILKMKYFIDVADHLSFTKAAQQNYVSQTAVSQQIAAVERELEVQLFLRDKGRVALTPAGEAFYQDCARILRHYDKAVSRAQRIQCENGGVITIGFLTACKMSYLHDIINRFHQSYPNTDIKLRQCSFEGLRQLMESGELDVALAPACNLASIEHIHIEMAAWRRMGLLVSRENPLAQYDEITVDQMKDQDFVMISPQFAGQVFGHMVSQRRKEGFEPRIMETADSSEILVMLVELNRGACFLPEKTTIYNHSLCKMLHISDNDDNFDLSIAWQKDDASPALSCFLDCLRDFFHNRYEAWADANQ